MIKINKTIGIDASNVKKGGGITHLIEFLNSINLAAHDDLMVVIWGGELLLSNC